MAEARELTVATLQAQAGITSVISNRIYQFGSFEDIPDRPFLVCKFLLVTPVGNRWKGGPRFTDLQVWAHDDPGDYLRIDSLLNVTEAALEAVPHTDTFLEFRFAGRSQDFEDEGFGTICKYSTFRMTTAR